MSEKRNICPECGGRLLIEAVGAYGDVYRMRANGEMGKVRLRRTIYETTGEYLIYCEKCGKNYSTEKYGF